MQEAVEVGRRFQPGGLGDLVVVVGVQGSPEQEATQVELASELLVDRLMVARVERRLVEFLLQQQMEMFWQRFLRGW